MDFGMFTDFHVRPDKSQADAFEESFNQVLRAEEYGMDTVWLAEQKAGIDSGDIVPEQAVADVAPRPLLIVHGLEDETISPADSEAIFAAAGEPKELWLIPGADHAKGATAAADEYRDRIVKFFDDNL